jgi:hypothetical protein
MKFNKCNEKRKRKKKDSNNLQIHEQKENRWNFGSGKKETVMATLCII